MELNIDNLIYFFQKNTRTSSEKPEEMEEQDAPETPSSGGGSAPSSTVPKWADLYALKRGKANMLGKSGEKWNTGLNRGLANQVW